MDSIASTSHSQPTFVPPPNPKNSDPTETLEETAASHGEQMSPDRVQNSIDEMVSQGHHPHELIITSDKNVFMDHEAVDENSFREAVASSSTLRKPKKRIVKPEDRQGVPDYPDSSTQRDPAAAYSPPGTASPTYPTADHMQ